MPGITGQVGQRELRRVKPWGNLTIVTEDASFPARSFSFSPNEKIGKLKNYSHATTTSHAESETCWRCAVVYSNHGDVSLWVHSVEHMDMVSSHPNLINASVLQLSFASTHADAPSALAHTV